MSDEVRRQVDERWDSLGIALPSAPGPVGTKLAAAFKDLVARNPDP